MRRSDTILKVSQRCSQGWHAVCFQLFCKSGGLTTWGEICAGLASVGRQTPSLGVGNAPALDPFVRQRVSSMGTLRRSLLPVAWVVASGWRPRGGRRTGLPRNFNAFWFAV
jgi:hypothetical protein